MYIFKQVNTFLHPSSIQKEFIFPLYESPSTRNPIYDIIVMRQVSIHFIQKLDYRYNYRYNILPKDDNIWRG